METSYSHGVGIVEKKSRQVTWCKCSECPHLSAEQKKFSTKYNGIPDKAICGSTHFAMMLALLVFATVLCSVSFVEGTVFLMPHFRTIPPNLIKVSYLFSLQPWLILSLSSFVLLNYYY